MVLNLENYSMVLQVEKDGKTITYYRHNTNPKDEKRVDVDGEIMDVQREATVWM